MGYIDDADILESVQRRVFLDIDPGFGQMWRELGLHDPFRGHEYLVTIGERIGQSGCSIPTCGVDWIGMHQPIVLNRWPATPSSADSRITSIATWRGAFAPIEYAGRTYGLRVHEFRKFASFPQHIDVPCELALHIDAGDERDRTLLERSGWRLVDPRQVAGNPHSYQSYIQGSYAEFMVAKTMYVETRSGWFSDRSICYLATAKPVIAQDTGLADLYPVGEGLLTFTTLDEAVARAEELVRHYANHARCV
jgi:hypothetical protein